MTYAAMIGLRVCLRLFLEQHVSVHMLVHCQQTYRFLTPVSLQFWLLQGFMKL